MINIAEAVKKFITYMANRNNPNEVNFTQLGTYSKEKTQELLDGLMPMTNFPVSKYGDNSWVPPNVLGSFEGGQQLANNRFWASNEEPNGDIAVLENATNGVKSGVYYTFITPQTGDNMLFNPTPREYNPKFLENYPGHRVHRINSSNGDSALWGRLIDDNKGTTKLFVALTAGTLDGSEHVGAVIKGDPGFGWGTVMRHREYVYIFTPNERTDVSVFRCLAQDIIDNDEVEFERVTGWSTTGIDGKVRENENSAKYCDKFETTDPDDPETAAIYYDTNLSHVMAYSSIRTCVSHYSENKVRMLYVFSFWAAIKTGGSSTRGITHLMDFDFDKNEMIIHPYTRGTYRITNAPAPSTGVHWDSAMDTVTNKYGHYEGQLRGWMQLCSNGRMFRMVGKPEGLGTIVWFWCSDQDLTLWHKLEPENYNRVNQKSLRNYRRFGSYIGGETFVRGDLGNGIKLMESMGSNPDNPFNQPAYRNIIVNTGTLPYNGFDFKLDNGSVIKGYQPVTDIKLLGAQNRVTTSLCTGIDKKITHLGPGLISLHYNSGTVTAPLKVILTSDGLASDGSGSFTATPASFKPFHDEFKSIYPGLQVDDSKLDVRYDLWIAPASKLMDYPPMVKIIMRNKSTRETREGIYLAGITFSSGDIKKGGVISAVNGLKSYYLSGDMRTNGLGTVYFKHGYVYEHFNAEGKHDWSAVYPPFISNYSTDGGNGCIRTEKIIMAGATEYNDWNTSMNNSSWWWGYDNRLLVDGLGPVFVDYAKSRESGGAAIFYRKRKLDGTWDDYTSGKGDSNDGNFYIWVSAQVSEGWDVYFTDETDVLLRGKYYLVPTQQLTLKDYDVDPSDKKYYVHLKLENGELSYVITDDVTKEFNLRLGYILTNRTQIETINVVKVVTI